MEYVVWVSMEILPCSEDTAEECADVVSHVCSGLVLQSRLCPCSCLSSIVAPDLSHCTTKVSSLWAWSVNI